MQKYNFLIFLTNKFIYIWNNIKTEKNKSYTKIKTHVCFKIIEYLLKTHK